MTGSAPPGSDRAFAARYKPLRVPHGDQCLRDAVAVVLRKDTWKIAPRANLEDADTWFDQVGTQRGVLFKHKQPHQLPILQHSRWIAFVPTDDPATTHAVPMQGWSPLVRCPWPVMPDTLICGVVPVVPKTRAPRRRAPRYLKSLVRAPVCTGHPGPPCPAHHR